jgi:pyruvate dehydrogenase E1 component alpha subunit
MLLIRRFEEKAGQLYGLGLIGGFCHLYIGQEAVAVGLQSALAGGKDSVITGYRDHGHMLAYGIDPKVIMAELTGRQAGSAAARAARCTCSRPSTRSTAATASSARRSRSAAGSRSRHKYRGDGGLCLGLFRRRAAQPGPGLRDQ